MMLMRIALAVSLALPVLPCQQEAQRDVHEVHHRFAVEKGTGMARIEMQVDGLARDTLTVAIPIWKPGSYRRIDFYKDILNVSAVAADGTALSVSQPGPPGQWSIAVAGHAQAVFRYEIPLRKKGIGRSKRIETDDGSYKEHEAYLFEGPGTWLYVVDRLDVPQRATFDLPKGWKVATGMTPLKQKGEFTCPDYDVLADCPFHIGKFEELNFKVDGVRYEIALSGFSRDKNSRKDVVRRWRAIVKASLAMMGEAPFDRYVFLIGFPGGGGLEHLNSTNITMMSLQGSNKRQNSIWDSLVAHEFFHLWNVKRLRPRALGPFDYANVDPNRTRYLWVCEGFTSYYGDLLCVRAGLWDTERYWTGNIAGEINTLQRNPGRRKESVAVASETVWDYPYMRRGFTAPDYYNKGQLLGLLLDVEIRDATDNKASLDDVMRGLYKQCIDEGRGFADGDVRKWCEKVGQRSFEKFFADYVDGVEELPYVEVLAKVGLRVTPPKGRGQKGEGDGGEKRAGSGRWKVEYHPRPKRRAVKIRESMTRRAK